jgi:hypothetical protein
MPQESERSESLAVAASERVRAIVQAAEASAAEIERAAHHDAERIRAEAAQSTHGLLERLQGLEEELAALVEDLRGGAGRIATELASLQEEVGRMSGGSAAQQPAAAPAPARPREPATPPAPEPAPEPEPEPAPRPAAAVAPPAKPAGAGKDEDVEGARLVALDMALSGKSRAEADRFLSEHYELPDRAALLDDVYSSAGSQS